MPYSNDISDQELSLEYWLLTHKEKIFRIIRNSLFTATVFLFLFVLFFLITIFLYFGSDKWMIEELRSFLTNPSGAVGVRPLSLGASGLTPHGQGGVSAYAFVSNEQEGWRVSFEVVFTVDGKDLEPVKVFLLPKGKFLQDSYAVLPGIPAPLSAPLSVRTKNVFWQRMSHEDAELLRRFHFVAKDIITTPPDSAVVAGKTISSTRVQFSFFNDSPFTFWELPLSVAAISGESVLAVQKLLLLNLKPGEQRTVEARWPGALSFGPETEYHIDPVINFFDRSSFRLPEPEVKK